MPQFQRYIGIDYSGAKTPTSGLKSLQVYEADHQALPRPVLPLLGPPRYWTRRGIAQWLNEQLLNGKPALVGIDHAFSSHSPAFGHLVVVDATHDSTDSMLSLKHGGGSMAVRAATEKQY